MSSNFLDKTGLSYLWSKITALIPSKLPNPQKLTVNGTEYDGSTAVTVTISGGGGGGLSSIVAGTGAGSEIFNQDENNTLDPTTVTGDYSHIEGKNNIFNTLSSSVTGATYLHDRSLVHMEGQNNKSYGGNYSHIEGQANEDYGRDNHLEGSTNKLLGNGYSSENHIEGNTNTLTGRCFATHTEGYKHSFTTSASEVPIGVHIEGNQHSISTSQSIQGSHFEGYENSLNSSANRNSDGIHIEGYNNTGMGMATHIEGYDNRIATTGRNKDIFTVNHVEGSSNKIDAPADGSLGNNSHIEGTGHTLSNGAGYVCHIEGRNNSSPGCSYQHIQGYFADTSNSGQLAHIVGNGSATARSNAHTLDWDGNAWYEGTVEPEGGLILHSSTPDSTKKFLITVDDSGTLSATEIVAS